ncbi:ferric reduction oxidase 8, mitochondrial isoform X1 [Nicotiana sylvestris]|uniref:Ferric reduction oxidase 8, mitochondrial isoform X1 n=1 Tax=Nicotiana sylvestris TaxID=4096 RepID=A0A1U7YGK3_NICSY|nr:PREDICTED: ferric reduction oxidase 8, mitochondrial isoform X1 [Nicotiana sylvestris]
MTKIPSFLLKLLLVLIFAGWVSLWLLKPTQLWTKTWKIAEAKASTSFLTQTGPTGLNFAVYTFPVIAIAIVGFMYLELKQKEPTSRKGRSSLSVLSNPLVVSRYIGMLSGFEILAVSLFVIFLAWTFYSRISSDFKKMIPIKSFALHVWQYRIFRVATRCGLLAEACLALLLLPILRGMSIFRLIGIQFEASVRYHIWLGTAMILFATLHGGGTFLIWGMKHRIGDEMWKWQKVGRIYLAGEISLVTGLVIWITSLPQIRRKRFEIFYYTHHLYIVFILFFLLHAGDRHFYMVFPGIFLFCLDKILRIIQSRPETYILSARIFPSKAIELTLPKDPRLKYTPTSVIYVKIPNISNFQWHPFSITSSSKVDKDTISILIKAEGRWTRTLYNMLHSKTDAEADGMRFFHVATEGPYGPSSMDFLRYDSLLLVAGGIGVTPFFSILQEIASARSNKNVLPVKVQLVYTIKDSQSICLLDPVLPQVFDEEQSYLQLKVFVTREHQANKSLREVLDEVSKIQTIHLANKRSGYAVYGLENLRWMAVLLLLASIIFLAFLSIFNHIIIRPNKKSSEQKTASSIVDVLLICSFALALISSTLVATLWRWKRLSEEIPPFSETERKPMKPTEANKGFDQHEIHFGARPNFKDIFSQFANESKGSNIGVFVCGPETMKESAATTCHQYSQTFQSRGQEQKPSFSFHPLNFTL